MQATAQIPSKAKTQQQLHVKCTETDQGPNHRTVESVYHMRVLSYIYVRLPVKGLIDHESHEKNK